MPLPPGTKHGANQSTARAKTTRRRCLNPSAHGCRACRLQGARKLTSIKRSDEHPDYRHNMETLEAKRDRNKKLAELREIEDD